MPLGVASESQNYQKLLHLSYHIELQFPILFLSSGTPTPPSDADATTLRGQFLSTCC